MADTLRVHVRMTVSDLAKSREFYGALPGRRAREGQARLCEVPAALRAPEPRPRLGRPAEGRGPVDHLGIQVESREIVVRELARVKAAGLAVRAEFGVECCHANQDKFWDRDGVEREVYVLNRDLEEAPRGLRLMRGMSGCAPA